jgi:hypothetical protein
MVVMERRMKENRICNGENEEQMETKRRNYGNEIERRGEMLNG